jgi:hypothetical protein
MNVCQQEEYMQETNVNSVANWIVGCFIEIFSRVIVTMPSIGKSRVTYVENMSLLP